MTWENKRVYNIQSLAGLRNQCQRNFPWVSPNGYSHSILSGFWHIHHEILQQKSPLESSGLLDIIEIRNV